MRMVRGHHNLLTAVFALLFFIQHYNWRRECPLLHFARPLSGARTAGGFALALRHLPNKTLQCLPPANMPTLTSQSASQATMPGTVRILLHTHPVWSGLMLGSLRPPPALPYWPLTEPKSPLRFAATSPPTVFGSCLVNLDSIQLQNPSERTERKFRRKNAVRASPCLNIKCLGTQGPQLCV